ncbi:MAG: hypothetical protein JF567_02300 [Xanthomonadales bacterium]|nr:hypothetical protein [Xanthomonadales bacterium]
MIRNLLIAAGIASLSFAAVVPVTASAATVATRHESRWDRHHPRRDEVNDRLANQKRRIREERKEGDLSKSQAHTLRKDDRQIRQEERDMASQNGGHITRAEQRTLNQQENAVSRQIGK